MNCSHCLARDGVFGNNGERPCYNESYILSMFNVMHLNDMLSVPTLNWKHKEQHLALSGKKWESHHSTPVFEYVLENQEILLKTKF